MTPFIKPIRLLLGAGAALVAAMSAAEARAPEIYLDRGGVFSRAWEYAVGGYDVVAYFDLEKGAAPVVGDDDFVTEYLGVRWRFSSRENLEKFRADPDRYRPAYGGYCAWAMARDKLAKGDPKVWYVYDGTLYLNVSPRYERQWLSDIDSEIARADGFWPGILERN